MSITAFTKACASHTPGVAEIWLGSTNDFTSGVLALNEITGMLQTLAKYVVDLDGVNVTQTPTGTKGGLFYVEKTIEIKISKLEETMLVALRNLAENSSCGICAVYQTNNGSWFVSGSEAASATVLSMDRGLYFETGEMKTGNEPSEEDADMVTFTLKGTFATFDYVVADTSAITVSSTGIALA